MRDWKNINYTDTMKGLVDNFNLNSESSEFIDNTIGTILCNGVLFSGNETIEGLAIEPMKSVGVKGNMVNSDTIIDNFTLYYRETNNMITLDQFPVDLLNFADGKPHFLYIKEDLTYRVSDYMFGYVDEILLFRFVINTDRTWNQIYVMAQRVGTPEYSAADEFYITDGILVKSPSGLQLSHTPGTVKRSGIDFTDKASPDLLTSYNQKTEALPIRYINSYNEVDYSKSPVSNVITNKYMEYNAGAEARTDVEETIRSVNNLSYGIVAFANTVSSELHTAIVDGADLSYLQQIVRLYRNRLESIYELAETVYEQLGATVLSSVDRTVLRTNIDNLDTYVATYLSDTAISNVVNERQVTAIKNSASYVTVNNTSICANPLLPILKIIEDELSEISFNQGEIKTVANGKYTVQRILWDVYENVFILQYGNKVYNTLEEAFNGTALLDFPAPFNRTLYIPLAILLIKSGITSINDDPNSIIIERTYKYVKEEYSNYADYVARSNADKALDQINKIINGTTAIDKANSLKCTVNGQTVYKDGNYFLNYNNLSNKLENTNNLTTSTHSNTKVLSAYQGYVLNQKFANYLSLSGGTVTGTISSSTINPRTNNTYSLGSSTYKWGSVHATNYSCYGKYYTDSSTKWAIISDKGEVDNIRCTTVSTASSYTTPRTLSFGY